MIGRWFRFLLAVGLGAALGLLYGWVVNPVQYVDTTPQTLRIDYKTDYVLMVAEAYQADGDLALAARRLVLLGDTPPGEIVKEAMIFAGQAPYADSDRELLVRLATDLQNWNPLIGAPGP